MWDRFDGLVAEGQIVSTREVLRETNDSPVGSLRLWATDQQHLFHIPNATEGVRRPYL